MLLHKNILTLEKELALPFMYDPFFFWKNGPWVFVTIIIYFTIHILFPELFKIMCNKAIIYVHLGFLITPMGMVPVILVLADYEV